MFVATLTFRAVLAFAVLLLAPLAPASTLSPAAMAASQCAHTVYYESCVPGLSQMTQCTRSPLKGPCKHAYCPQHCSGKGVCRGTGDSTSCDCNSGFAGHFCTLKICPKVRISSRVVRAACHRLCSHCSRTAQDMAVAKLCRENAIVKQVFMKTTAASAAVPATAGLSMKRMQTAGTVVFCSFCLLSFRND
jgi:hypothetical protein